MKHSLISKLGLFVVGFAGVVYAQDAPTPMAAEKPVTGPTIESKQEKKVDFNNRIKLEFDSSRKLLNAFYQNDSQARVKIYSVTRFDPDLAKPREYFLVELRGSAIIEPLKLDADDAGSIEAVVSILNRFQSESEKSSQLKVEMTKRKAVLELELSREETRLVELQASAVPDATALDASKNKIAKLKGDAALAGEIGAMEKITGDMGSAKINLDRPAYKFMYSFEPAKDLYTLTAGYSFQVAAKDVKFYVDLLKRTQEFKGKLLDSEDRNKKLRQEVDALLKEEKI
jgi:hypothetical protein